MQNNSLSHCSLVVPLLFPTYHPIQIDWEKSSSPISIFSSLSVFSCLHPTEVVSIIGVMSIWNDLFVVAFLFGTEKWLVKLKWFFFLCLFIGFKKNLLLKCVRGQVMQESHPDLKFVKKFIQFYTPKHVNCGYFC